MCKYPVFRPAPGASVVELFKLEQRQDIHPQRLEEEVPAGRLVHAVRTGVDPQQVDVRVRWADPATRSVAQEADAAVKLFGAGVLDRDEVRARLGLEPNTTTTKEN